MIWHSVRKNLWSKPSVSIFSCPHAHTHTHTRTHTHTYTHTRTYTHTHTHTHIHAYTHIHTHTHARIHTHTHMHTHTYAHNHPRMCIRGCVCVHAHITHTHTTSHICIQYIHARVRHNTNTCSLKNSLHILVKQVQLDKHEYI